MKPSTLQLILARLQERLAARPSAPYHVPGRWRDPFGDPRATEVVPESFFIERIQSILAAPARPCIRNGSHPGDWSQHAVTYNLLVRYGAAFDHNQDGAVTPALLDNGWRETGTFLKAIALLPHIQALGCNTVHLLPITTIGRDGNKGDMGSAFAIRDPYGIDEHLAEPALGLDAATEFTAFVEAAHHMGIRVIVEFVFRTAAKDSVWAKTNPEWFYWIRADVPDRKLGDLSEDAYAAPTFTRQELDLIYDAVGNGRFDPLLPPHDSYLRMFLPPPPPESVRLVNGQWRGLSADPATGESVEMRVPGAFCDWGPDSTQPPWTDVTYLRLYDHPDFNYMAYNTVRMYAAQLAAPENIVEPLWEKITEIIPHYQREYRIDGVMIDMGHALPSELKHRMIHRARQLDPDFALWAEEFGLHPGVRAEGYNVCLGPFMQRVRDPEAWQHLLEQIADSGVPVPFMATGENHNTPRATHWPGGKAFSLLIQTYGAFLPAIPYIHNGAELTDPTPVNTGFDFTDAEIANLPPSVLPLFSAAGLDWTRGDTLVDELRRLHALRARYHDLVTNPDPGSLRLLESADPAISGYLRQPPGETRGIAVVGNRDMETPRAFTPPPHFATTDLLTNQPLPAELAPGQVVVLEVRES